MAYSTANALDTELTTCTITHPNHTEIMTCIFGRPRTPTAVCTRSHGTADDSPPLRLRINGLSNVTYVPESPESMLHIFIARDLYRDHKEDMARMKRTVAAAAAFASPDPADIAWRKIKQLDEAGKELTNALIMIMAATGFFVFLVAMANTRHMLTVASMDQKTFLSKLLKRNDIVDQIQECDREKRRLQEQLARFDLDHDEDEDEDDSSTL